MKRTLFTGIGFAVGALILSACAPPLVPPPVVVAAPPPVVLAVAPVPIPPPPPMVRRYRVRSAHPAIHRHWTRRYVAVRTHYVRDVRVRVPGCGSVEHPCNVEHVTAPFQ